MKRRLIDANALIEKKRQVCCGHGEYDYVVELYHIEHAPTVDAVEVVHGQWIPLEYDGYADGNPVWDLWECSECGNEHSGDEDTLTPYCPNCGAKMDGDGNVGNE